jgi:hypothetical protein
MLLSIAFKATFTDLRVYFLAFWLAFTRDKSRFTITLMGSKILNSMLFVKKKVFPVHNQEKLVFF